MAASSVYRGRWAGEDGAGVGAHGNAGGDRAGSDERGASGIHAGRGAENGEGCTGAIVYGAGVFSDDRETHSEGREIRAYCLSGSTRRFFVSLTPCAISTQQLTAVATCRRASVSTFHSLTGTAGRDNFSVV